MTQAAEPFAVPLCVEAAGVIQTQEVTVRSAGESHQEVTVCFLGHSTMRKALVSAWGPEATRGKLCTQ